MKHIAILPLRKNSKGIPGKNKKKLVGRPLFSWVAAEAIFSNLDVLYIFTDDQDIIGFVEKEYAWTNKIQTVLRSDASATDTASTELAMVELAESLHYNFDTFTLLQATSPFTKAKDINSALELLENPDIDSVVSVVKTHRFTWSSDGKPQNYDVYNRPRRQDFDGLLIENGAIYSTTKKAFQDSKNRVSGKICTVEMPEYSLTEIDSTTDWLVCETLLAENLKKQKTQQKIDYLVLDVDGVFTDGCVYYNANGEMAKKFDMRDGMGLEILRQNRVEVVVVTSENSELVAKRMKKLQIQNTFLGVKDKYSFLQQFLKDKNSSFGSVAYVGDDVNDLANICSVGWSFAPNNAIEIIKNHADFVISKDSANGAIREVCEIIMKYNKRYEI
jgi:YrbI family 3-deoxy-D-manno-octulosonate 8-phosphate phosphatase